MWNRSFISLWIGQAISQIGNRIYLMALAWYMVAVLNNPGSVILFFIISSLPSLLFGMFIGPLVEHWNKKHTLIVCDLLSGLLTAVLAWMVYSGSASLPLIYGISFLLNTINLFFSPSANAILPTLIDRAHYQKSTSLMKMMTYLSQIMGAAVGGILVGLLGVFWSIALNALSFILSALLSCLIRYTPAIRTASVRYLQSIREGFHYLGRQTALRQTLLTAVLINLFLPSFLVTIPIIIKQELALEALHYGIADAAIPVGAVCVSLLLALQGKSRERRPLRLMAFSLTGIAAMYLLAAAWQSFVSILMAALSFGFLTNYVNIQVVTYFMEHVPADFRGRIFSLLESFSYASISLSFVIASVCSSHFSIYAVLLLNGSCLLVLAARTLWTDRTSTAANP